MLILLSLAQFQNLTPSHKVQLLTHKVRVTFMSLSRGVWNLELVKKVTEVQLSADQLPMRDCLTTRITENARRSIYDFTI